VKWLQGIDQAVLHWSRCGEEKQREGWSGASGESVADVVALYEMAHRGFQDAVKALRQLNESWKRRSSRIA